MLASGRAAGAAGRGLRLRRDGVQLSRPPPIGNGRGSAYAVFIPADFYYSPSERGDRHRVNAAAALGYGVVLYGLAVIIALLGVRAARVSPAVPLAAAAACAGTVALLASSSQPSTRIVRSTSVRPTSSARRSPPWRASGPAEGTTIYLFGVAGEISPNVFTFVRSNDLSPALRLLWNDDSIMGVPVRADRPAATRRRTPASDDVTEWRGWRGDHSTPYGTARFVDVRTGEPITISRRVNERSRGFNDRARADRGDPADGAQGVRTDGGARGFDVVVPGAARQAGRTAPAASPEPGARVLDAGCGTGGLLRGSDETHRRSTASGSSTTPQPSTSPRPRRERRSIAATSTSCRIPPTTSTPS